MYVPRAIMPCKPSSAIPSHVNLFPSLVDLGVRESYLLAMFPAERIARTGAETCCVTHGDGLVRSSWYVV
jgi:hypothetical protein